MEILQWLFFFALLAGLSYAVYYVLIVVRRRKPRSLGATVTLFFDTIQIKTESFMYTMKNGQRIKGTFQPVDDKGNNAKLEPGSVVYSTTDEDLSVVQRDRDDPENELAFEIVSKNGFVGPVTNTIKFDGHVGEGDVEVVIDINGEVTSRDAVGGQVVLGEAIDLPEEGGEETGQ